MSIYPERVILDLSNKFSLAYVSWLTIGLYVVDLDSIEEKKVASTTLDILI